MTSVFELQSVFFQYGRGGNANPWVLSNVNLHVNAGEVLGIVGPNGSGKTSLLKLLARLVRPQKGEITLYGQSLKAVTRTRWRVRSPSFRRALSRQSPLVLQKRC